MRFVSILLSIIVALGLVGQAGAVSPIGGSRLSPKPATTKKAQAQGFGPGGMMGPGGPGGPGGAGQGQGMMGQGGPSGGQSGPGGMMNQGNVGSGGMGAQGQRSPGMQNQGSQGSMMGPGGAGQGQGMMGQGRPGNAGSQGSMMGQGEGRGFEGKMDSERTSGMPGPGMQTCRVDGVEVPGKCEDVEGQMRGAGESRGKMGGPGGEGMMGPGGFGPGGSGEMMGPGGPGGMMGPGGEGDFGPDEEQMQKMQLKGMFNGMKQGLRGMTQGIKMMKKTLAQLEKQGVSAPQELSEAIVKAEELIAYMQSIKSVNDITDADAFMDKMSEMPEVGSVLQEWGPRLGDLFRMGQMMKEAQRRLKQVERDVKRAKAQAAKSKVDLSDLSANLDTALAALKQAYEEAKAKTDPEEKQDVLESLFESMQNIYDTIKLIDGLKNLGKMKADWTRQVKQNDRELKQLQRKKLDLSELAAVQTELKAKFDEFQTALAQKPIDQDVLVDLLEEAKNLQAQFRDLKDELLGTSSLVPQIKAQKLSVPKFDLGSFEQFRKAKPQEEIIEVEEEVEVEE